MRNLYGSIKWLAAVLPVSILFTLVPAATAASFTITTASVPNGVDGVTYSAQLASANGAGKVTWAPATGSSLVKGLTLSTTGKISGTPTGSTNGPGSFKVTAKDSASPAHTATATIAYIINPENGSFRITTTQFPNGTVGSAFTSSIKSSGGTGKVTYKLIDSTKLPAGLSLSAAGAITGKPTAPSAGKDFWVEATDSSTPTAKTVKAYLGILIKPAVLKITANLPAGSTGVPYGGVIDVAGGASNLSWMVNGTAVPTNGNQLALGDNLNIFFCSGGNLCIGGSPSSPATLSFKVSVKDSAGATGGPDSFSITINESQGSAVTGQVNNLNNWCGNGSVPGYPPIKVTISTSPARTTTADSNGNYSFANVPAGTYTITPSISIAGSSSVFYPATQRVTLSGSSARVGNITFSLGYTVSGTVNYAGTKTGRIYLALNSNCGGTTPGISIPAKGAFTIRGVAPGSYTLQAWMDNLGYGAQNASNPSGSTSVKVSTTANFTGANVTLANPSAIALSSAPQIQGVSAFSGGAMNFFNPIQDNNGLELASSYTLEWSTTKAFTATTGSKTFAATGTNGSNIWIVNGLADGAIYYFRAQGVAGTAKSQWSNVFGPVTIAAPSAGNAVSGTVSFNGAATGPLYTGFYNQSTGDVYVASYPHPVSPQVYSVHVPSGSGYIQFGIIDQNNDGMVDPGDIQDTNGNNNNTVTVSGPLADKDLTLPSGNSSATLSTSHYEQVNRYGTAEGYNLNFSVNGQIKLPAAVTLVSGPNVLAPMDIGECNNCGGGNSFSFYSSLATDTPKVGDTYDLLVTYSDGTSQTLTAKVSAVLSAFAIDLSPTGTGGSTTPTFKWTDPADAGSYTYNFNLWDANGNQIWQIPDHDSGHGFPSTITSITWGTDPTGSSNPPSVGTLTSGETYNWQIQVQDENGNSTQMQVSYEPNN
jgi:hypothetical protein